MNIFAFSFYGFSKLLTSLNKVKLNKHIKLKTFINFEMFWQGKPSKM